MPQQRNSDVFLGIFSELEKWLRAAVSLDKTASFYQVVERSAEKNPAVRRYKDDLKEFADLRNAIVHERTDNHVIAEPNERVIADFEHIRNALLRPPKVIPQFQRDAKARQLTEPISSAVIDMRKGSFSQLPVLRGGEVVALLTTETVVRWLASEAENDMIDLMRTEIGDVQTHVEDQDHYCFLSRNASLHEALEKFEDYTSHGKDLDGILITDSGRADQKLLGILTVYDLPSVLKSLGLRRLSAA